MKRTSSIPLIFLLLLGYRTPLQSQITGYTDFFDGDLKMLDQPYFTYSQANGILRVDAAVPGGVKWQGFKYAIGDTLDLSNHAMLNLKLKSNFDFLLTAYIMDPFGFYKTVNQKIQKSDTYVHYFIPFEITAGYDSHHITHLLFTPNGNTTDAVTGTIWLDELKLGTDAQPIAGIGGVTEKQFFSNSQQNQIKIVDLKNATQIGFSGGTSALTNMQLSTITNEHATVTFDCQPAFTGQDTLQITAIGSPGFADNSVQIPILIEDNAPPTIDSINDLSVQAGDTISIRLTGLSDGNKTVEQSLAISASSDNQLALPDSNLTVLFDSSATVAALILIPVSAAQNVQVTLKVDDGFADHNITERSFKVNCFPALNHPPTIDEIPDQFVYLDFGAQTITLTGIGDGDDGAQQLSIKFSSADTSVVKNQDLAVHYVQGASTAELIFTPTGLGKTEITVTITDNGGTAHNNGDAQSSRSFLIESASLPQSGIAVPTAAFGAGKVTVLENPGDWNVEGYGNIQKPVLGTFQGKENVLKITFSQKTCWTGIWYLFNELDVSQHRYMCYDIYFEGGSFGSGGKTHSYFRDVNDNRNLPRAHAQRKTVPAGQWRTVFMDYRGQGGMDTEGGEEINVKRINRFLLNYATDFVFPFPTNNGTVYLANIKVGRAVPDSLVPALKPTCTIDPMPDQTLATNAGQQKIRLCGIGNGIDMGTAVSIRATSSKPTFIPNPVVSPVNSDGTAELSFQPGSVAGNTVITVTVSAAGSNNHSISFTIYVVASGDAGVIAIELDPSRQFQTIRGFGTFEFSERQNYLDYYTRDLGASAVRIGLIGNQIEPVNDNNDPKILDMAALNYDAFDFDYFRQLKARGVETFILTSWSPPAWMKRNLSLSYGYAEAPNYQATDNILEPYYYDEFAESMVAAVKMFRDAANIDLYAIGPQNEPAFNEPYPSAVLSPVKLAELIALIGDKFQSMGLNTKIYMPEQVFSQNHYSMDEYINFVRANNAADQSTDIIATHSYAEDGVGEQNPLYQGWTDLWNSSQRGNYPKELWMSEAYPEYQNWQSALSLAGAIHGALVYGNVSLWSLWSIEGTLMDKGQPTASFYTSKNYYKFIRPGARRINVSETHNDLLASAFIDPKNKLLTTVMINKSAAPLKVTTLGDSIPTTFDMYLTAEYINFQYQGNYAAGQFMILPPKSVTTCVGSMAGDLTGVIDIVQPPPGYALYQNYPNPFNPQTHIEFSVGEPIEVQIVIYNQLGQQVRTLARGYYPAGQYQITWNGKNDYGQPVASGIYFYRIKSNHYIKTRKCVLLR
ncbi:T9SS type A sorting domain-containing protein [candidate division KSB1 bacterium]|nr:T9SS type A sorting domain-containing protein [candidate division KSB1 bacterium]